MRTFFQSIPNSDFKHSYEGKIIHDVFKENFPDIRIPQFSSTPDREYLTNLGRAFDFWNSTNGIRIRFANGVGYIFLTNGFNFPQTIGFISRGNNISDNTRAREVIEREVEIQNFDSTIREAIINETEYEGDNLEVIHGVLENVIARGGNLNELIESLNAEWPYADCSSWEYAMRNGVRGAVVDNISHSFVTQLSDGNIGFFYVSLDILYFTMPTHLTNGQAATRTSQVVNNVNDQMEDWVFTNGRVSNDLLAIKYYAYP